MSTPVIGKVSLVKGDTWLRAWILRSSPKVLSDLTGVTARLHVRDPNGVSMAVASTVNGKLTITPLEGRVDLVMPPADTSLFQYCDDGYSFSLELTSSGGEVRTVEVGTLHIVEDSTYD